MTRFRLSQAAILSILLFGSMAFGQALRITKGPVIEHVGTYTAVIAWSTNASSATVVKYGTDPNNLNQTAEMPWGGLTHRVEIKNLQPGTRYYFQVDSGHGQGTGTNAASGVEQFTTNGQEASASNRRETRFRFTNAPELQQVNANSAVITWGTDVPSSSIVKYGTDPNNLDQMAERPWGATDHRVQLNNLSPNTTYYFSIHSGQGKNTPGQALDTPPQRFRTSGQ